MVHTATRFGEAWRVLAYALVLALGFVLLGRLQVAAFTAPLTQRVLQHFGPLDGASDVQLAQQFDELSARYKADQNGVAARVQQQLSPWHRPVYLLGVHIGIESARIETTSGEHSLPPAALIRRHATLAGIDATLWQPLAAAPIGESAAQRMQRCREAVQALARALAQQDASANERAGR